ncbi:hypothetical protein [Urbifossiella limnaea]|uniref:hypothetical protein n=1 Tax=Urbifossiella limnaea TaxID=2528023 RepID=UPI001EE4C684|nr:hypothetical protein [Urbifossiella limnaea]
MNHIIIKETPMEVETAELTEVQRRELFAALVAAQDEGLGVKKSRQAVAARFGVDAETVVEVEDEGLDKEWPPLGKK